MELKNIPDTRFTTGVKKAALILTLICICAGAFVLRSPMIKYSVPFVFHPDEFAIANAAMENVRFHRLNPHYYLYPMYSVYAYTFVDWAYLKAVKTFRPSMLPADINDLEPKDFYVINRIFSVALSIAAVLALFWLGTLMGNIYTGLGAAVMLALSYTHIDHSWLIKPDPGMVLFTILAFVFIVKTFRGPSRTNLLLAFGLSMTAVFFKYNAAALVFPLALAVAGPFERDKKKVLMAAGICVAALIVSFVPVMGAVPKMLSIFLDSFSGYMTVGQKKFPNTSFISYLFDTGMGWLPAALCFTALGFYSWSSLKNKRGGVTDETGLLCVFIWPVLILLIFTRMDFKQHVLIIVPLLYVLGVKLLYGICRGNKALFTAILLAAALSNGYNINSLEKEYATTDPRLSAREWVLKNIPPSSPVIYEQFGPPLCDYDPGISGSDSLTALGRDITFSTGKLSPRKLYGYDFFIVNKLKESGFPADAEAQGTLVKEFTSGIYGRPDIRVYENTRLKHFTATLTEGLNVRNPSAWSFMPTDRDTKASIEPAKRGVALSFTDAPRKDAYHFFITHTDLNAFFKWQYTPKKLSYLRVVASWDNNTRLDIALACMSNEKTIPVLLEGKRGLNTPKELIFPLPSEGVTGIVFSLNTPVYSRATNNRYYLFIDKIEVIDIK